MFKIFSKLILLIGILVLLNSCQENPWEQLPRSNTENQVNIIHFSDSILGLDSISMLDKLEQMQYRHPIIFFDSDSSYNWKKDLPPYLLDPEVQALYKDALKSRMPLNDFTYDINSGVYQYKMRFQEEAKEFDIYTYISRNEKFWILEGPKHFFIPWDRYLGSDHPLYAREAKYQLARHDSDQVIIELFRSLSKGHIPKVQKNSSLLSAMINSGKSILFLQTILGDSQAQKALNMDVIQNQFMINNESALWKVLLKKKWLFDNSFDLKRKLIEAAPFSAFTTSNDQIIPGQAGAWFGWRILQNYWSQNPELALSEIMDDENVNLILQKSGYRP